MKTTWLVSLMLTVLLGGCGKKPMYRQTLRISSPYELLYVDPQKVCNDSDYKIIQAMFEGLLVPDPETMDPLPGMAERWTVSNDGRIYEFFLRDTAKWSDGTPVVAEDFVYAARRALSSRLTCPFVEMFFPLQNAKLFFDRTIRDFSRVGIYAVDFRTLRIELEKKNPYFLTILMHPCWSPLNETVVKSFDQHHKNINVSSAFKTKIISNGPFVLAERMPGAALLFTKNDQYWDADNVLLTSVTFSFSRDQVTETRHFYERTVDIIETLLDSENIVSNLNRDELMVSPSFSCFGLAFNTTTPPFGDKNVRRALSIAIDREKLLDKIDKNRRLAAYGFISKNGRRRHERLFQRDAELAKQLLLEAGYGNNFPKIEVLCSTSELELNTAAIEQVIKDWKTILGIDSRVNCRDLGSFFEHRKRLNFDIIKVSFEVKHCDPMSLLNVFASDNPENHGKWHDKQYDEIIDKLGRAVDEDDYEALVEAAELRLADEMPVIPLFFGSKSYLVNKAIKGWFANEMNMHPLKFVYCEGE